MSHWEDDSVDPMTHRTLVRFYVADSEGRQVGPDTSARIMNAWEFLIFSVRRGARRRSDES